MNRNRHRKNSKPKATIQREEKDTKATHSTLETKVLQRGRGELAAETNGIDNILIHKYIKIYSKQAKCPYLTSKKYQNAKKHLLKTL